MLADDAHPAISHFTPEQRAEIRRELNGATVRRVGLVMMGTAPASNVVYNAAANVTTAVLGGPDALTALIRKRDAAFAAVSARRYMLRNRRERGDNEAPAIALAALYQRLAARRLAGIDAPTMDAIHEALRRRDDPALGRHYDKDGNLDSDPLSEVRAGWYETAKGPLVYVVMTMQPTPGPAGRDASSQQLAKTADALAQAIVEAGWAAMRSAGGHSSGRRGGSDEPPDLAVQPLLALPGLEQVEARVAHLGHDAVVQELARVQLALQLGELIFRQGHARHCFTHGGPPGAALTSSAR